MPKKPPVRFTRGARLGIGTIRRAVLAPDSRHLGIATSSGVAVYRLDGLDCTRVWFEATPSWATGIAFSGDGKRVVCSTAQNGAKIWDVNTGKKLRTIPGEGVTHVALDREGGCVAIGDRAGVSLWDVESGAKKRKMTGAGEITAVAFHPVEATVAAVDYDGHVVMWSVDTGRELRRWQCARPLRAVAFSRDGAQLAAAGKDWTLWDIDTGMQIHSATMPGPIISLAFSVDGEFLITGTSRNRAVLWDLSTGARAQDMVPHLSDMHSVASAADGSFLLLGSQKLELVAPDSGAPLYTLPAFARLLGVRVSPSGDVIALADKQLITLWGAGGGEAAVVLDGHTHTVSGAWFRAGGKEIVSYSPCEIICWDCKTGERRYAIEQTSHVGGASLSRDGTLLAAAVEENGAYTLGIWDAGTGERDRVVATLPRRGIGINEIELSPDGRALAVRTGSRLTVWDVEAKTRRFELDGMVNRRGALAWSPDNKSLAVAMDNSTVVLRDARRGSKQQVWSCPDSGATGLVWSADGTLLAGRFQARPADEVMVWSAATGKLVQGPLPGSGQVCQALVISPDNSTVVAGFSDNQGGGEWVGWHLATGEVIARHEGEAIWAAAFSPDGRMLITGTGEGTATIWEVTEGGEGRG